jgi:pimeloyl-ACP methyl ester carboxylesterase
MTKEGLWSGIQYPRAPGHEVAGVIDVLGSGVTRWAKGQRVGVGWHGGHCGYCDSCRRGDFVTCQVALQIPGISYDGGYSEYMITPAGALARIPDGLSAIDAAPLILHGDDDQIVPIGASAMLSSKIVKNAQLKIYKGAPHGMCTTLKENVNENLLAFIKS